MGKKITQLTEITTLTDTDLGIITTNVPTVPASRKVTWANIKAGIRDALGVMINALTAKTTPADADMIVIADSAASNASKKVTWSNIKATLKTYFDGFYTPYDGWIASTATFTYSSADAPIYVLSTSVDMTGSIQVGDRFSCVHSSATKYFIVHAITSTTITLYGGTDYTLSNSAITSPRFSHAKSPVGFPMSPEKWSVTVTDTTTRTRASPTNGTWYNLGSVSITAPIGVWNTSYVVLAYCDRASAGQVAVKTTLSTANNSESDASFSRYWNCNGVTAFMTNMIYSGGVITRTSKQTYYFNTCTDITGSTLITNSNAGATLVIKLVDAYL